MQLSCPRLTRIHSFNGTLFAMMDKTCNSLFNYDGLSVFKNQRYNQSLQENPNFFYGPIAFVLFAAAVLSAPEPCIFLEPN